MATAIVGEMREGSASVKNGNAATLLVFSSQFHFLVVSDDINVTREDVILNTSGLPFVGITYGLINAVCTGIDAKRRKDNAYYWDVTCSFETGREYQKRSTTDPESNDPTTWIPVFVIDSFETKQRIRTTDKSPTPQRCVNSANQPFTDPLVELVTMCSYTFTQFEDPSQDINTIMDRNDTVNKLLFRGRAARTLKLNVTSAELGYYLGVAAWRVGYRVTYDRDTWDERILNVGPNQLVSGKLRPCMDGENQFRIVARLNPDGTQGQADLPPYEIVFRMKTEIDFNTFIRV